EVRGLYAALVGRLAQQLEPLDQHEQALGAPLPPAHWAERLLRLLEDCFLAESERDQLLLAQLQEALEHWLELCDSVGLDEPLPLTVVAEAWLSAVGQPSLSQRFLAGA